MKQEVNLYQPGAKKKRPLFSGADLAFTAAVLLAAMGALYAHGSWVVRGLDEDIARLSAQRDEAQGRLAELDRVLPPKKKSAVLESRIEQTAEQINVRRALLNGLSERGSDRPSGFSGHLEGLARQHVDGLWLTGLRIQDGGRNIALEGSALHAALVPAQIERFSDDERLAGLTFHHLTIKRTKSADAPVDFVLGTRSGE